jgi:uncharacterized protein YcbX
VDQLWIYPVKSCAGIAVKSSRLTETGLQYDREWVVVDAETRKFITQRQQPQMALISTALKDSFLILSFPGHPNLPVPLEFIHVDLPITVTVWKDQISGYSEGTVAAEWLSAVLGRQALLIRKDPNERRTLPRESVEGVPYEYPTQAAFADTYPILVVTEASLRDVARRVAERDPQANLTARNFRPNIVLHSHTLQPYEEDEWDQIYVECTQSNARVILRMVLPCTRCTIPNIDPDRGVPAWPTLKTLMSYRRGVDRSHPLLACFGMNAVHDRIDVFISAGDKVIN